MHIEKVQFQNARGIELSGSLHAPVGPVRGTALFAHCFACSSASKAAVYIARELAARGFRVLRFDFTGLGDSGGEFQETVYSSNVDDLLSAARYLEARQMPVDVLVGHSLGGTAALAAARRLPTCRAVATIAAPARAEHIARLLGSGAAPGVSAGPAEVDIGGQVFHISENFLDDLAVQSAAEQPRARPCALLVMHAPLDKVVDIENASEIFASAVHPKSFVSLDDADHLLSREQDGRYAASVIAAWAARYVDDVTGTESTDQADWVSAATARDGFSTEIVAGRHRLLADEPVAVGGTDEGPSPYELLSAALASCTSMTLQLYARRKGIDLDTVVTRVRHSRIHAEDCADCETRTGKIDSFERRIQMFGKLAPDQHQRLLEIADLCPVHKTLRNEIRVSTHVGSDR